MAFATNERWNAAFALWLPSKVRARKKGRLRCHKRPKSREKMPKEGSDSGWEEGDATACSI
jgi:hypothetical protein